MSTLATGEGGGAKASLTTAEGYLPALCETEGESRKLGKRQRTPKGLGLACVGGQRPRYYPKEKPNYTGEVITNRERLNFATLAKN